MRSAALPLLLVAGIGIPAPAQGVPLRLPNGLTARLQEDHEAPLIRLEGLLPISPAEVPEALPGLPTLLLATLAPGPKGNRSASEFQALAEGSAIRLDLRAEGRGLRVSLICRSRDQELAFGLLGDLLARNLPDPTLLEGARTRLFRDLRDSAQAGRARWIAEVSGSAFLPPPEGTLIKAGHGDLEALQARIFRPERLRLELQGDLSPSQAQQLLLLALGAWQPRPGAPLPPSPPPSRSALLPLPEAVGTLWLALPVLPPEDPAGALLALLLPERLEGLQGTGRTGDPWRLRQTAATPGEALRALEARLGALAFTEADTDGARRAWRGQQALLGLEPSRALEARLEGLPTEAAVARITAGDLTRAFRALGEPAARSLLWTGDAAWLKQVPAGPAPRP